MKLSIHYYVLALSERSSRLFEGFREDLIDIHNSGFPFDFDSVGFDHGKRSVACDPFREFLRNTDRLFARYFNQDPLGIIVIGERQVLSVFKGLTNHREAFIGELEGDYTSTSSRDLGRIAWPVVKQALAGTTHHAIIGLEKAAKAGKIVIGLDAVGRSISSAAVSSLFVEEDYHVKGSIRKIEETLVLSPQVDVREVLDDAVDVIVDRVLDSGGNVVFLDSASMTRFQRIALING
jgi:hypothetical protein